MHCLYRSLRDSFVTKTVRSAEESPALNPIMFVFSGIGQLVSDGLAKLYTGPLARADLPSPSGRRVKENKT